MAITPRFEANIGADISSFMKKAATVDKTILKMASGVIVDIDANISNFMSRAATVETSIADLNRGVDIQINGDISDLQSAIAEANAGLAGLNNDSTININGNSSNFDNAVNHVNKQKNTLSRRITEARIGADIGTFESRMVEVSRALAEAGETVTPEIELEMTRFTRDINEVQNRMREIARSTADPQVEADITGFMAQMAAVQAQLDIVTREHDVDIRVDAGGASARLSALWLQIRSLTARDFVANITARWANYQAVMGAMASFSRNFSEIVGMTARGITIAMSPAIVPVLSSVVGLLGNLGPMIGTIGGSMFALATSFGAAGIGAAGFAAVAIPSIGKVVETSKELKEIEEKIAKADTWKERNKLMKEQQGILDGMSKAQAKAGDALTEFKSNYSDLVKDMESPVLDVFAGGLTAITGILGLARPMIENVTDTFKGMMDTLNANLAAEDVKAFFRFLEDFAGPALETVGKAVGNFVVGLFNMMEAFGPLASETQNSFLNMSESFRSWSAGLSENKGFQKFADYVSENMPKIRSIFSDAINGVIHMFAAFGDSSSNMMTKLESMMEGFLKWSKSLSESQGFKNFIDYIQTNGPVVVSTIGEIVDFIINIGKAAAPAGEYLLGLVDSFLNFTNGLLANHSWIGKVAVALVVLGGSFLAVLPTVVALNALLGGLITKMILYVARTIWAAAVSVAKWIWMGVTATLNAIKVAAAWTLSAGIAMASAVARTVIAVATTIAQWVLMGIQAGLQAIRVAAAWTLSAGIAMATAVASTTIAVATVIGQWLLMGAQALIHAAKVAGAWLLSTGAAMATAVAGMIATSAVFVAKWVWMGAQALIQGARMAAGWLLAMGPVGWVIAAVVGLAAIVIANWDKISSWTQKTWSKVSQWISTKWEEAKLATGTKIASMVATTSAKFAEIVSKVKAKMTEAKTALSNKWEEAKSATSSKLSSLVSTVSTFFANLVSKVREKMSEAVSTVGQKVGEMPGKVLSFVGAMLSAGSDLVSGLISGIKNMAGSAIDAIAGVVDGVVGKAKSLLKIKSPSRVFMQIGDFVGQGLAKGVTGTAKQVQSAATKLTDLLTKGVQSNAASIVKNNKQITSTTQAIREQSNRVNELMKQRTKLAKKGASTFSITNQIATAKSRVSKSNQALKDLKNENVGLKAEQTAFKAVQSFAKSQMAKLNVIAKQRDQVATKLKLASDKLADAVKMRDDFAKSVQDKIMSFGSIGNVEATSGVDIAVEMKNKLQAIKDFQANIKKLQNSGLNDTTLQDIINAGVEGGGAQAAALASSSSSVINDINKTQNDINARAKTLGKDTAEQFYGVGVDAARGMVKGLESQAKALEKSAKTISDALVKAVKKKLDIHSPSRVFASLGGFVSKGLAVGIDQRAKAAIASVSNMAAGMTNAFSPQLAIADMKASATLDTSIKRADMKAVKHSFAAEIGSVENNQPDIILVMDGREVGRVTAPYVDKEIRLKKNVGRRG